MSSLPSRHKLFPFALALTVCANLSNAGAVFQLDARLNVSLSNAGATLSWQALGTTNAPLLTACGTQWHDTGNGVANISKNAEVGPLLFAGDDATNVWVKSVVMVVQCAQGGLNMRETIACGEEIFRLGSKIDGMRNGATTGRPEQGLYSVASWKINTLEGENGVFKAGETALVEFTFSNPLRLSEIAWGADFGRKSWKRGWRGNFKAIIGFSETPSENVLAGTRTYLNTRWQLGLDIPRATPAQITSAQNVGVRMQNLYSTLLLIR